MTIDISMWDESSEQVTAAKIREIQTLAVAAVEPMWPYLSHARTPEEFESRMHISTPGLDRLVSSVVSGPAQAHDALFHVKRDLRARWDAHRAQSVIVERLGAALAASTPVDLNGEELRQIDAKDLKPGMTLVTPTAGAMYQTGPRKDGSGEGIQFLYGFPQGHEFTIVSNENGTITATTNDGETRSQAIPSGKKVLVKHTGSRRTAKWIDQARAIVENKGFRTVTDSGEQTETKWRGDEVANDDGSMVLDAFTASMLVQIYDALGPENKAKFDAMSLTQAVNVGWKLVNKTKASKTAADGWLDKVKEGTACPECDKGKADQYGKCTNCGIDITKRLDLIRQRPKEGMQKGAPFAGYEDFEACVKANSDKDDPEAYCGKIKHQVEDGKTSANWLKEYFSEWSEEHPGKKQCAYIDAEGRCQKVSGHEGGHAPVELARAASRLNRLFVEAAEEEPCPATDEHGGQCVYRKGHSSEFSHRFEGGNDDARYQKARDDYAKERRGSAKTAAGAIRWTSDTHMGAGYLVGLADNNNVYEVYYNPNSNPTPCSWACYGPEGDTGPNSQIDRAGGFKTMEEAVAAAEAHAGGSKTSAVEALLRAEAEQQRLEYECQKCHHREYRTNPAAPCSNCGAPSTDHKVVGSLSAVAELLWLEGAAEEDWLEAEAAFFHHPDAPNPTPPAPGPEQHGHSDIGRIRQQRRTEDEGDTESREASTRTATEDLNAYEQGFHDGYYDATRGGRGAFSLANNERSSDTDYASGYYAGFDAVTNSEDFFFGDGPSYSRTDFDPRDGFPYPKGSSRHAVNENAYGTERYQPQPDLTDPDWVTHWWDEQSKVTKEVTDSGRGGAEGKNPFADRMTTVRQSALRHMADVDDKMEGFEQNDDYDDFGQESSPTAYTTRPRVMPNEHREPSISNPPVTEPAGGNGSFDADPTLVPSGDFGMDTATMQMSDPMVPTIDQMVAAKIARLASRVQIDNPSMSPEEARHLAAATVAKYPEMIRQEA